MSAVGRAQVLAARNDIGDGLAECRQVSGSHVVWVSVQLATDKLRQLCDVVYTNHTTTVLWPFSGTTQVSQCQKRTSGLYGWVPLHLD